MSEYCKTDVAGLLMSSPAAVEFPLIIAQRSAKEAAVLNTHSPLRERQLQMRQADAVASEQEVRALRSCA